MYLIQDGEVCEIKDEAKARTMLLGNAQLVELLIAEILNAMDYCAGLAEGRRDDRPGWAEASVEAALTVDELRPSLEWLLEVRREIQSLHSLLS